MTFAFAKALPGGNLLELPLSFGAGQPVVLAGIHQHAVFRDERQLRSVLVSDWL